MGARNCPALLEEPDGRSHWIRRLDGTLLTDDNSGVYGEEWGLTVGGGWPLDELHGGTRDSTDALMHFGARHMLVEDGRWLQPEPLLYMGVTNGDLTNPLGYGPVYARGNSNLYGDPTGEMAALLAVPPATAAAAVVGGVLVAAGAVAIGVAAGDPAVQSVVKAALPTSMPDAAPEHGGARAGTYLFGPEVTVSASTGETPASQEGATPTQEIIEGSSVERPAGKGCCEVRGRDGGEGQRDADFETANVGEAQVKTGKHGEVRVGVNAEGQALVARPSSTDSRPTLEIQGQSGKPDTKVEIRYNE